MQTIVVGALNTDLIATGYKEFPKPGEYVIGNELMIKPGGKSRNIADMIAQLTPSKSVALVGRTVRDPYGFWKIPIEALHKSKVNTDYVTIVDFETTHKLPGITFIPVNDRGQNQIYVLPGVSDDFNIDDIEKAEPLFKRVGANQGCLVVTLECPVPAVVSAIKLAKNNNLKVLFDPGGITDRVELDGLIDSGIYLIKPNEHEAKILTGKEVNDLESAKVAAKKLQTSGIPNILITHGAHGAYLFTKTEELHIPIPHINHGDDKDETGCGDQTMAALCACIQAGKSLQESAQLAVRAGTIQFQKKGIQPLTLDEIGLSL